MKSVRISGCKARRMRDLWHRPGGNSRTYPPRLRAEQGMKWIQFAAVLLLINTSLYAEQPLIVAHRGASRYAPENTISAFNLAWEQGADAIEGDFHLTADGHIVCIHDRNTKRVSDRDLIVSESTLAELRELDVGAYRGEKFTGSVVPTIAEVFSTIPAHKKIYIEIKCGSEIIPVLIEEITKSGLQREQVVMISFHEKVIQRLKSKTPQYKAFWLSGFKKDESGNITPSLETVLETLKQINADGFSSNGAPEQVIQGIRQHGYECHAWTIDDLQTARRYKEWGVRSITTNVPDYLKKNLFEQAAATDADKPCGSAILAPAAP